MATPLPAPACGAWRSRSPAQSARGTRRGPGRGPRRGPPLPRQAARWAGRQPRAGRPARSRSCGDRRKSERVPAPPGRARPSPPEPSASRPSAFMKGGRRATQRLDTGAGADTTRIRPRAGRGGRAAGGSGSDRSRSARTVRYRQGACHRSDRHAPAIRARVATPPDERTATLACASGCPSRQARRRAARRAKRYSDRRRPSQLPTGESGSVWRRCVEPTARCPAPVAREAEAA
jgi:hypothetical protein